MKRFLASAAVAGVLAVAAGPGHANITIVGGSAGDIPAPTTTNDFLSGLSPAELVSLGLSNPLGGWFGAQLKGTATRYIYDYFGAEAGNVNTFDVQGGSNPIFTHNGGTSFNGTTTPLLSVIANSLNFALTTSSGSPASVTNNGVTGTGNNLAANPTNFFLTFGNKTAKSGNVVWLFFDDSGAGPDDNHDDFVVRITAVPLPAGVLLLGLGLGGLAAYRRRQTA